MGKDNRYRTSGPGVVSETVDDETIIVNLDTGAYYDLNPVGSFIWRGMERGQSADEIAKRVAERFSADSEPVDDAVRAFLERLGEEGLITERTGPVPVPDESAFDGFSQLLPYGPPVIHKHADMQELLLLDPIHEVDEAGWPASA